MLKERKKILFWVTEDWFFCSHRLPLATAARDEGHDVVVVTRVRDHGHLIEREGIKLIALDIDRHGINPIADLLPFLKLLAIFRREKPDIVHHVAMKPMLYGSIAARMTGVASTINAVAGFGYLFSSNDKKARWLRPVLESTFRRVLNSPQIDFIVQNPDDKVLIQKITGAKAEQIHLVPGSGVDISAFTPEDNRTEGELLIVLVARMLRDKGVNEFVQAAKIINKNGKQANFVLVGDSDFDNPAGISEEQLESWQQENAVEWWGRRDDIAAIFSRSDIVCLPSYREGLPKVLIEAAASGRPIVTTDVPGCRDVVRHGHNGLLVPLYDADSLAAAIQQLIDSPADRLAMGKAGRARAENEFTIDIITERTLEIYRHIRPSAPVSATSERKSVPS